MNGPKKVLGIVGSYREGGTVDTAVDDILAAAADEGATTEKILLKNRYVEFCTNCPSCTTMRWKTSSPMRRPPTPS